MKRGTNAAAARRSSTISPRSARAAPRFRAGSSCSSAGFGVLDRLRGPRRWEGYDPRLVYLAAGLLVVWAGVWGITLPVPAQAGDYEVSIAPAAAPDVVVARRAVRVRPPAAAAAGSSRP